MGTPVDLKRFIKFPDLKDAKDSKDSKGAKDEKDGKDAKVSRNQGSSPRSEPVEELYKRLKEDGKTKKLDSLAPALFDLMAQQYASNKEEVSKLNDIKLFLSGKRSHDSKKNDEGDMDHCVRWHILLKAVDTKDRDSIDAATAIGQLIVENWPVLAFVCIDSEKGKAHADEFYKAQCKNKEKHKSDRWDTPFHLAAKNGNHKIIKIMIETARDIYLEPASASEFPSESASESESESGQPDPQPDPQPDLPKPKESLLDLVLAKDPESGNYTALMLALKALKTPLETLEEILEVTGSDTPLEDESFDEALKYGLDKAVEAYLRHGLRLDASTMKDYIITAFKNLDKPVRFRTAASSVRSNASDQTCRQNVIKSLVRRAATPAAFDQDVVERIIEKDLLDVWKEKKENVPSRDIKARLLHTAVLSERFAFVEKFVEEYPQSLTEEKTLPKKGDQENAEDKYPLWYNNHRWNTELGKFVPRPPLVADKEKRPSERAKIRDAIVTKMIHVLGMDRLPDILHRSHEPFDDLCFDMSRFNSSAYQVSDFIGSLIYQDKSESRQMLKYEHTLKYVEFPSLDMMIERREAFKESTSLKTEHDEVFQILDWLSVKGVTKIIKLVVPDRLVNPHDELEMARYVRKFQVEVLDWKVLDLSISIFKSPLTSPSASGKDNNKNNKKETENLQELYLYASGKRAVVHHWFNKDDGVESLGQLKKLQIHVVRETCTADHANKLLSEIQTLQENLDEIDAYDPFEIPWYPAPSPADLSKIASRLSPKLAAWLGKLVDVVNKRNKSEKTKHRPTRVAILDNGVLSISPVASETTLGRGAKGQGHGQQAADMDVTNLKTNGNSAFIDDVVNGTQSPPPGELPRGSSGSGGGGGPSASKTAKDDSDKGLWSRIKAGRSFVDSNSKFCPWQFPSDPHGTQMANLICAIDPFCEIYVARVAEDAFGIKAEQVTKAIDWAIQEEVDIISMSFALSDNDPGMQKMMVKAYESGIVMTCSTHDEGSRTTKAYPAGHKGDSCASLMVLAACDEYGKLLRDVERDKYHYKLRGEHVPAGVVPFVKSNEHITGSSAATALAAGLCSLILTCDRLAHPTKNYINNATTGVPNKELDSYRIGMVQKHLDQMQSDSGTGFVVLEMFGGIVEKPRVGQDIAARAGRQMSSITVPSAESVLREKFGMA